MRADARRGGGIGGLVRIAAAAGALAGVACVGGCGSSDPNRELTTSEQAALLRDIRKDPSRVQDLTPAERKYLIRRGRK